MKAILSNQQGEIREVKKFEWPYVNKAIPAQDEKLAQVLIGIEDYFVGLIDFIGTDKKFVPMSLTLKIYEQDDAPPVFTGALWKAVTPVDDLYPIVRLFFATEDYWNWPRE